MATYNDVFEGLGHIGSYHIELDTSVHPSVQNQPRRVPVPLQSELKSKLNQMERDGIIATVTTPTKWISNMVTVKRPDKLRVCIDPRDLNHAIRRPHFPMRTIEDVTPRLANSKVYSVADAKDGFLQIELDKESSYLTTF